MSKEKQNNIKCDVESCKYNDCKKCELDNVTISCDCPNDDCTCKDQTICKSFKERN